MTSSRSIVAALALLVFAGCAEVQQAGSSVHAWPAKLRIGTLPRDAAADSDRQRARRPSLQPSFSGEEKADARERVAIRGRAHARPTPQQLAEIKKKSATSYTAPAAGYGGMRHRPTPPPSAAEAPKGPWHCVMIWDTWAKEVVGNDCYAVTELPAVGETARFDTYAAEYIGSGG